MRFMLDENVAFSVSRFLTKQKVECEYIRDLLPSGAVDPLVAFVAEDYGAILVSHDGDFQKIAPRIPDGQRRRFRNLSRIHLRCSEPESAKRVEAVFDFVRSEFSVAQQKKDKRMQLIIGSSFVRSNR